MAAGPIQGNSTDIIQYNVHIICRTIIKTFKSPSHTSSIVYPANKSSVTPMPVSDQNARGGTMGAEEAMGGRGQWGMAFGGRGQRGIDGTAEPLVTHG